MDGSGLRVLRYHGAFGQRHAAVVRLSEPRPPQIPGSRHVQHPSRQHLAHHLGKGVHYCLGAHLARLEGRVVLDELLNRWPEWGIDYETARLAPTSTVRGWEELRLVLP